MESKLPSSQDIRELTAFLPILYADGFQPVIRWHGGTPDKDGVIHMPYPEYNPVVVEFYRLIAAKGWLDYGYQPEEAYKMLKDPEVVKTASLPQVKRMLTFCVRGERFSDGHWEEMIQKGYIRALLERLIAIGNDAEADVFALD